MTTTVRVESLDLEGRGVARVAGKVTFIDAALPGESVEIQTWDRKPRFDLANAVRIVQPSSMRVAPGCPHYERCGGCSLQHLDTRAQVAIKQRVLEDNLARIGRVQPETILPAIHGPAWHYRQRARMSVRMVARKGGVLVGFRERRTHYVVEMDSCEVLPERISALIVPLRAALSQTSLAARIPQVEIAVGEGVDVLVLRVLDPLTPEDLERLRAFARTHRVDLYLQPGGPATLQPLEPAAARPLFYRLPEFDLVIAFHPSDFTQVNHAVNQVLVRRAIALLDPQPGEQVADMFCGLGNFTLALARRGAQVAGVDASQDLIGRAAGNAQRNGLSERARFWSADLYAQAREMLQRLPRLDKMLVDPPRDGAAALVQALGEQAPRRLVYVSCNPATLARDAGVLVAEKGYRFCAVGVVNMFPHTSHVESIALFERD
jgi:23S rRNA (uracil1939-C5)-methyltransferase